MATVAELLGETAAKAVREAGPKVKPTAIHYMAAGLPGCPLSKDGKGRVRHNGRFVAKP